MLSAHVLSLKYHLPPDKSENDQDGDTDHLHIVLTYMTVDIVF